MLENADFVGTPQLTETMMMGQSADFLSTPELNYEQWREVLRPNWGLYTPDEHKAFAGRVRSRSICGFNASDISNNIRRCERTKQDVRLDGVDHWYAERPVQGSRRQEYWAADAGGPGP
jgi:hypothetical protein